MQVDRIFSTAQSTRSVHNGRMDFKLIPRPASTPRIQARRTIDAIEADYQRFMLLFWEFHCQLEHWRSQVDERLFTLERKMPPT